MPNPDDAFHVRKPRPDHPKGFKPGFKTGPGGYVVSNPIADRPDEDDGDWGWLLEQWQLDPSKYRVEEPVEIRSWDQALGDGQVRTAYYVKARLIRQGDETTVDYDSLLDWVRKRPKSKKPAPTGDQALVVALSDWQLGKADGYGTAGTIRSIKHLEQDLIAHARGLRAMGVGLRTLAVLGMGDLVEGCDGFYAQQTYGVELDRRQQVRVARELLVSLLDAWAPHFEQVQVAAVGGNHGENRRNGKSYTTFGDNDDLAIFEQTRDVLTHNDDGRYEHFLWLIPDDQLSISMDVEGTVVGMAHGHQMGGGKYPETKVWDWWRGQALGQRSVAHADLLCTAHFHTFVAKQDYGRWHLQSPTLDGGSRWFAESYGAESTAGTLTFVTGQGRVDHIRVLEGKGWGQ